MLKFKQIEFLWQLLAFKIRATGYVTDARELLTQGIHVSLKGVRLFTHY